MRNIRFIHFVVLCMVLVLSSCSKTKSYAAEIYDLNGTWQPDWSYQATLELPEEEREWSIQKFSWGEGKSIPNTTFHIDLTSGEPFIDEPGLGRFPIIDTTQTKTDVIKIHARRRDFIIEIIFHFVDKDTLWIESDRFGNSTEYGKGALWHRISGPSR